MNISKEGYVEVAGGSVWFQVIGGGENTPLLYLHGGPGIPHYPFESLADLSDERPVVFYHQLGCGKSDRPTDPDLWVLPRFIDELDKVRKTLALEQLHILGHSWGGTLAAEYALSNPEGIRSIIFASPLLSTAIWLKDTDHLKKQLSQDVQNAITVNEERGTTDSKEYKEASDKFYSTYGCRQDPLPDEIQRARKEFGLGTYLTMWGPSEFHCTGNLKDFDCTSRLNELKMPILFTCGRYDEATPQSIEKFQKLIPGSEMVVFEDSAHHAELEERERYLMVVRNFLKRAESKFLNS